MVRYARPGGPEQKRRTQNPDESDLNQRCNRTLNHEGIHTDERRECENCHARQQPYSTDTCGTQ